MNVRDSEIAAQLLYPLGYLESPDPEQADLILINTCSVREKAQQKVYSLLGQLAPLKEERPGLLIGVLGCVAQQEGEKIFSRTPFVDLVCGTQQIYRLAEWVARLEQGRSRRELHLDMRRDFSIPSLTGPAAPSPAGSTPRFSRFVTIMTGCNNFCSYCVVPATRGREISRPVADIIAEIESLIDQGAREITLLGQNVNSYGQTNAVAPEPVSFSDLLRRVSRIPGLERLRFTTSNPKDLSDDLIRCFAELDNLCPHFHLPVQSGSDRILKLMNRHYTHDQYLTLVEKLRKSRPDIALATDIIVGFPGETEEDFMETMRLLAEVRFHGSFSFKYSDRPGTRSADFPGKVEEEVKKERLARFQARQDEISLEWNQSMVDSVQEVMVENCAAGSIRGRTPGNHIVHATGDQDLEPGRIARVLLTGAGHHSLRGRVITDTD